jgi:hypothetical protein
MRPIEWGSGVKDMSFEDFQKHCEVFGFPDEDIKKLYAEVTGKDPEPPKKKKNDISTSI